MKKGIVILAEDYCPHWEKLFLEEKPHSVGIHFRPFDYPMKEYLARINAAPFRRSLEKLEQAGILVEHELHAGIWLLPRELYKKEPLLFRWNGEKRDPSLNYCFSSERASEIVSERAYLLAKNLHQHSTNYYIWPDDSLNGLCSCENCKDLSGADQAMLFANAVVRGLRAWSPNANCSYLAYGDALQTPSVKPEKGVFLEFAPINRNFSKPLAADDEKNNAYRALLTNLCKVFKVQQTQILDDYLDISLQCGWKTQNSREVIFYEDVLRADLQYYQEHGIETVKTFAAYANADYFEKYDDSPFRSFLRD